MAVVQLLTLCLFPILEASCAPAQGTQLLQSNQLERGRGTPFEDMDANVVPRNGSEVQDEQVPLRGFFFSFQLNKDSRISQLQVAKVSPDDPDQLIQFFFVVILTLFLCALLALVLGVEDVRAKHPGPIPGALYIDPAPLQRSLAPQVHETRPVPLARAASAAESGPIAGSPVGRVAEVVEVADVGPLASLGSLPAQSPSPVTSPVITSLSGTASASADGPLGPATAGARKTAHLCQGLVVPTGSECVLAVLPPRPGPWLEARADVMDLSGKAVLAARLRKSDPQVVGRSAHPVVELKPTSSTPNAATKQPLAFCYTSRGPKGEISMDICKASGEAYARLFRDPVRPRYVMERNGLGGMSTPELVFDGLFEEHAVLVSELAQTEPTADAEPCTMSFDPQGKYYRLRVSSNVDVGLMICCLLSIDELVRLGA
mmetsp:Transcript_26178/g.60625  ORF Transcript_26178/g.60625 Transcript_26178/m.60625 type:complete len:431 (-) Transcript_26178:87-1379(-)